MSCVTVQSGVGQRPTLSAWISRVAGESRTAARMTEDESPGATSQQRPHRNLAVSVVLLAVLLEAAPIKAATLHPDWIAKHRQPTHQPSSAKALAVDSEGKVFVAGTEPNADFGFDGVTVAYSSGGVPLWTNRLDLGVDDQVAGVVVGASGSIYVAGSSDGGTNGYDYTLLALSKTGAPLWTNLFDGRNHRLDSAQALTVDPQTERIYVTGLASTLDGDTEYATVAYSAQGACLWTNYYRGLGPGNNLPQAITVDSSHGNIYVTGIAAGLESRADYGTVAYSKLGIPLWTNRFDGPAHDEDFAFALVTGESGQVYVTGSARTSHFDDYATVAYASDGVPLWTNWFNGAINYMEQARAIAVGSNGNVIVTGVSEGFSRECVTIAYSSSGIPLWTNRDDTGFFPRSIAADRCGNVYVGGDDSSAYLTTCYSATGSLLWRAQFRDEDETFYEFKALGLDPHGNLYVTGSSSPGGSSINTEWLTLNYISAPAFTFVTVREGALRFDLEGKCSGSYLIQTSANLTGWITWTNLPALGAATMVSAPILKDAGTRFYRAVWTP